MLRILRREHLALLRRAQWVPERHLCLLGKPLRAEKPARFQKRAPA